ncbi:MAG TPA: phosphoribosyltransferase, partial [Anaerolineae bacterium]|nr:phosphoribosyltransferase [Anaerolineae bacterium]
MQVESRLQAQLHQVTIGGHLVTVWDHWRLYLDPALIRAIVERLEERVRHQVESIDYLCPIPRSGIWLGTLLAERLRVPLLNFWWGEGVFCQEYVQQGSRIVLFDPDVKTGRSLYSALTLLGRIRPTIECLVTV